MFVLENIAVDEESVNPEEIPGKEWGLGYGMLKACVLLHGDFMYAQNTLQKHNTKELALTYISYS